MEKDADRPCLFRWIEGAFAAIALATAAVLLGRLGWRSAVSVEVFAGTAAFLAAVVVAGRSGGGARARLAICYVFVCWFYGATSRVTLALGGHGVDDALLAIERSLFGETPSVWTDGLIRPWLSEIMSAGYFSYHLYMHGAVWTLLLRRGGQSAEAVTRFTEYFFAGFVVGFAGYLLLPALGPGAAFPGLYYHGLVGGPMTVLNVYVVGKGAAIYGSFPSLHLLVTVILLDHDWRWCRRRFWWMLGPSAVLVASTIYLRYHYAVDLLAGLGLFFGLRFFKNRPDPRFKVGRTVPVLP